MPAEVKFKTQTTTGCSRTGRNRNGHSAEGVVYLIRVSAVVVVINELLSAHHGTSGATLSITINNRKSLRESP
jgi:hypothetical protein